MTIASVYARKSTDQKAESDARSVSRQIESARAFAASRGWDVPADYIFSDDAISGAETKKAREPATAA